MSSWSVLLAPLLSFAVFWLCGFWLPPPLCLLDQLSGVGNIGRPWSPHLMSLFLFVFVCCAEARRLLAVGGFVASMEASLINICLSEMSSGCSWLLAFASDPGSSHLLWSGWTVSAYLAQWPFLWGWAAVFMTSGQSRYWHAEKNSWLPNYVVLSWRVLLR